MREWEVNSNNGLLLWEEDLYVSFADRLGAVNFIPSHAFTSCCAKAWLGSSHESPALCVPLVIGRKPDEWA